MPRIDHGESLAEELGKVPRVAGRARGADADGLPLAVDARNIRSSRRTPKSRLLQIATKVAGKSAVTRSIVSSAAIGSAKARRATWSSGLR